MDRKTQAVLVKLIEILTGSDTSSGDVDIPSQRTFSRQDREELEQIKNFIESNEGEQ